MISSTAIVWWIVFLAVSAFFSGMEVAFVSSDKLRYALDKKNKGPFNYLLNTIYGHPSQFLAVLSVGNLIALILFVFSTLLIFQPLLDRYISGLPLLNYLILILISTLIILKVSEKIGQSKQIMFIPVPFNISVLARFVINPQRHCNWNKKEHYK
jgi:putative hemolysin